MNNEAMQKNIRDYRTALGRIRADRDLSEEARQRMAGEVYSAAVEEHRRIVGEGRQGAEKAYNGAARSVFGLALPHGAPGAERAAAQTSLRDAFFRVSGVEDSDQLHRLQRMAADTGDRLLTKAILRRGYEMGDQSLVDAVCGSDPDLEKSWSGLMEQAQAMQAQSDPLVSGMYAPPRPEDMPADTGSEAAEAG